MKIGVPKEVKNNEARVAMTPAGVAMLVKLGHQVIVEQDAGLGSGFTNQQYEQEGACLGEVAEAWAVDLVVKVKEPQESEYGYLGKQMIFTFFHLAGVAKRLTMLLLEKGTTAIAYEALEDERGRLPILAPMSAVAGNMSVLMGAYYLARFNQGNGMQLGTILGKSYGKVVVIGDGVVGQHAAKVASAMGAKVIVAGLDEKQWLVQNEQLLPDVEFIQSNKANISRHIVDADLVVGAVLCRGGQSPKLVSEEMLKTMRPESVIVDVSIDQGGCFETSKPTTHSDPVFIRHGVTHYCVSNMPGAFPKASTIALTDVTISYIQDLAENALAGFIADKGKVKAINVYKGKIASEKIAKDLGLMDCYQPFDELLG
ncbi:MAG: alanine dehydrogenase [Methylococcaceae bacterium]|nr:alanine dehydrogenase [Methylococcaceae bacterium]